jgi:transposase-like protein
MTDTNDIPLPTSLLEAVAYYADKDRALAFLVEMRWPNGVTCPACEAGKPIFLKTRRIWKCRDCKRQFSAKLGTVFEDSPLGLDKWLPALWMLANCRNGISSYELARDLHVTQKTAWFMLGRIRLAMDIANQQPFSGEVEADETFIGGKAKNMHKKALAKSPLLGTSVKGKTAVLGLLQRSKEKGGSRVKGKVIYGVKRSQVEPEIHATVEKGSAIYTDALASYNKLDREYIHGTVDHSAGQWVNGRAHTNGLENFWSCLKRGIKGTYISIDPFHVFRYVAEQSFRFNVRQMTERNRFAAVARAIVGKRLTYTELTGADLPLATT